MDLGDASHLVRRFRGDIGEIQGGYRRRLLAQLWWGFLAARADQCTDHPHTQQRLAQRLDHGHALERSCRAGSHLVRVRVRARVRGRGRGRVRARGQHLGT